ncbi:uncharacterized protein LOC143628882 [Bidens hawaiensis]|uniref:uncharacterized protein LOC143628882 n=1 Tax=Bidens hawaiensis TaxID=980011 RepID=UPI00404A4804
MNSKQPTIFSFSSFSPTHFLFLFSVLVIFLTSTTISASYGGGNETDYQALFKIKSMITRDPYGVLTSWNESLHFCDWAGVICGKRHKRVTYLILKSQRLEGLLSPHIGNLSFLRALSLSNNSLQGTIPHEIGCLSRLRLLYLNDNKFNGVITANISGCSNLETLDLSNNKLVGSIPKEINFLSKVTIIDLGDNKLTGGIPHFFGNITSMEALSLNRNPIGGSIPDTFGHCKRLKQIYFGGCNLSGTIPRPLFNLSLLNHVGFAGNKLTGDLPTTMPPHLTGIQLYGNLLTGPLPSSLSNCSRLQVIDTSENKLSGKLTINFAKLRDINFIALGGNNFGSNEADEMKFLDSMKNCTNLDRFDCYDCKFQGVLPESVGNLSLTLRLLNVGGNELQGSLPRSIGQLVGLASLQLGGNQFTGNIPSTFGNLQKLEGAYFDENQLSGQIPDAMGNLSSLTILSLTSNLLEGAIPSSLGNCHNLLELYLDDNKLEGKIPIQVFQLSSLSIKLDLSQNRLSGPLPTEVRDLKMLSDLDLSNNNLSGVVPSSLGDCTSLTKLSLKGNFFQGAIPPSLSSLKGLVELDISHNKFSGQIPKFLGRLQYLNLSYNDFEGEVPMLGVFANASAFSILGNEMLCGGFAQLGLPKCKKTKKHRKRFPPFAIVILIATTLSTITCLAYILWCKKKRKSEQPQLSTSERFMKVSYNQLFKATNGFSEDNLIGRGGFSSVYKGILKEHDDRVVAVKVLNLQNRGAQRSFKRECEAWQNIRHRNLLKILTSCSSVDFQGNDFKALVYEFMPNGSLHDWLHASESTTRLEILQRVNILMDVACALDYIHNHCIPSIVHGDLKPSNILLDDDMVAHVGDFGLARFLGTSYQSSSTGIRGTIGYAAPEYGLGNEMTSSGDVYSFGILLLELMTGKKPTDNIFNEGLSISKFASMALPDHVNGAIDVKILNIYEDFKHNKNADVKKFEECLASTIKIGVSCAADSPQQRMDIKEVVHDLQHIVDILRDI